MLDNNNKMGKKLLLLFLLGLGFGKSSLAQADSAIRVSIKVIASPVVERDSVIDKNWAEASKAQPVGDERRAVQTTRRSPKPKSETKSDTRPEIRPRPIPTEKTETQNYVYTAPEVPEPKIEYSNPTLKDMDARWHETLFYIIPGIILLAGISILMLFDFRDS